MKKIAVLSPVHRRPDLLMKQIVNYKKFSNDGCQHILHISKEGVGNFSVHDISFLRNEYDVIFTRYSNGTSWQTCIGALIACTEYIDDRFDYVYMHTDGDLIISGNLQQYIYLHKLGYTSIHINRASEWVHYQKLLADSSYRALLSSLNLTYDDVVYGRQEGSFYPVKLWKKIINKIAEYYHDDFFDSPSRHWPVEESVIPTLAKFYSNNVQHVSNVVRTKEWTLPGGRDNPMNCVTTQDIYHYINDAGEKCVAIKWFSQEQSDPARLLIEGL